MPAQEHAAPNFQRTPGVSLSPSLKEVLARNANLAAQVGASILLRRARASRQRLLRGHGGADPRPARLDSEIGQVDIAGSLVEPRGEPAAGAVVIEMREFRAVDSGRLIKVVAGIENQQRRLQGGQGHHERVHLRTFRGNPRCVPEASRAAGSVHQRFRDAQGRGPQRRRFLSSYW